MLLDPNDNPFDNPDLVEFELPPSLWLFFNALGKAFEDE